MFPRGANCSNIRASRTRAIAGRAVRPRDFSGTESDLISPLVSNRPSSGTAVMMKERLLRHGPAVALGIGAGIAAAVLFSLAARATFVAAALANLSPLPIMIATLGYGAFAGATAVASATLTVAGLFHAQQKFGSLDTAALGGLVFAFSLGLPAFWLSLLSVLG